jgi:hypothetical protein
MGRPVQTLSGNLLHHVLNQAHAQVSIMRADIFSCENVL